MGLLVRGPFLFEEKKRNGCSDLPPFANRDHEMIPPKQ